MTPQPIDLQPFCGRTFALPSTHGEYTYATNGDLLIRVPARADVPKRFPARVANQIVLILAGLKLDEDLRPFESPPVQTRPCRHCKATGHTAECPKCEGESVRFCVCHECGDEHLRICSECDGTGLIAAEGGEECADCRGTGKIEMTDTLPFGSSSFADTYLRLLNTLPNVRLDFTGEKRKACHFVFDGGDGVIMPSIK